MRLFVQNPQPVKTKATLGGSTRHYILTYDFLKNVS